METRSRLQAFKASFHSETHLHQSQITKIVLISYKYQKSVKKSKEFENNDKDQKLRNGSCILLHLKVPKHPARGDTPQYHSESTLLVSATEKQQKSLKEINKSLKELLRYKNNSSNIGKCDIHSTILQCPEPQSSRVAHLNTIQTATIWFLELGNIKTLKEINKM